jgi:hypothetical protein
VPDPFLRVTVRQLRAGGCDLHADEAVAAVLSIGRALQWQCVPPAADDLVFCSDGRVAGSAVEARPAMAADFARLLHALLPEPGTQREGRVPGGVRVLVARALGASTLPPVVDAAAFGRSLERFAPEPLEHLVAGLVVRWAEQVAHGPEPSPRTDVLPDRRAARCRISQLRADLLEADLDRYALRRRLAGHASDSSGPPAPPDRPGAAAAGRARTNVLAWPAGGAARAEAAPPLDAPWLDAAPRRDPVILVGAATALALLLGLGIAVSRLDGAHGSAHAPVVAAQAAPDDRAHTPAAPHGTSGQPDAPAATRVARRAR